MDRPLRLIPTETTATAELARTIEALLVVASQPLTLEELQSACEADAEEIGDALELLWKRYAEGASGIVLEHVAGGFAFRASEAAADACARSGRCWPRPLRYQAMHPRPRREPARRAGSGHRFSGRGRKAGSFRAARAPPPPFASDPPNGCRAAWS